MIAKFQMPVDFRVASLKDMNMMGSSTLCIFAEIAPPWNAMLSTLSVTKGRHLVVVSIDSVDLCDYHEDIDNWFSKYPGDSGASHVVNGNNFMG